MSEKKVNRRTKGVFIRLGPEDEERLERLVAGEPNAEGEKSRYIRILLREEEARRLGAKK